MNNSRSQGAGLLAAANRLKRLGAAVLLILTGIMPALHAQEASFDGNNLIVPVLRAGDEVYSLNLQVVVDTNPIEFTLNSAQMLTNANLDGAAEFDGVNIVIPSLLIDGIDSTVRLSLMSLDPPRLRMLDSVSNTLSTTQAGTCPRPEPDLSNGPDNPGVFNGYSVPVFDIKAGGPPPDGIPPVEIPLFTKNYALQNIEPDALVVGVKIGDTVRAYPHTILDWHEIVNDSYTMDGEQQQVTLSYCPLTGSALLWDSAIESVSTTFGTSGLLYNSNLILYDRRTTSLWSQMLEQAIAGPELLKTPEKMQVVETTWDTWVNMYPETEVLSRATGFSRPYGSYPYGSFKTARFLFFPADNSSDRRLHEKERVLGINVGSSSKVYPISGFSDGVSLVNDNVGTMPVVAAGSSTQNFGVVFNRQLEDCTVLEFEAMQNSLPVAMRDNEGGEWDVFGNAVAGPRVGTKLQKTNSFISYWYAWTAFFPDAEIHQ